MMGQISKVLRDGDGGRLLYWCQGCDEAHVVMTGAGPGPRWSWNGDLVRPVFSPSVLTRGGRFTPSGQAAYDAWYNSGCPPNPPQFERQDTVCHTFIGCNGAQPGEVIFLPDCTHALAGQVHPLPDLPDWMRDPTPPETPDGSGSGSPQPL